MAEDVEEAPVVSTLQAGSKKMGMTGVQMGLRLEECLVVQVFSRAGDAWENRPTKERIPMEYTLLP
jgi:hypothetical protein